MTTPSHPLSLICATIGVCFRAVAVLKSVSPCAFILGVANCALSYAVSAFGTLCPFTAINPPVAVFDTQSVPFSTLPLSFVSAPTGSGVDARYFKTEVPRTGVGSLGFRPSAHSVAMGLAVIPTTTICTTIVKVESATVEAALRGVSASSVRGIG